MKSSKLRIQNLGEMSVQGQIQNPVFSEMQKPCLVKSKVVSSQSKIRFESNQKLVFCENEVRTYMVSSPPQRL